MRRDILELERFYATPLGRAVRAAVARQLAEAWGDARGLDVLGLGYATPYLDAFAEARRTVAAMPAAQGVRTWPAGEPNRAMLSGETELPLPTALFDRVLLIHAVEESPDATALLREAGRVLAPSGRMIVAAASRGGLWCHAEATPFGHGRPFTRTQLETHLRDAELEPVARSRALYVPPVGALAAWAETFELAGSALWPAAAGLVLIEATKRAFAVRPKAVRGRTRRVLSGVLAPSPVPVGRAARDGLDAEPQPQ